MIKINLLPADSTSGRAQSARKSGGPNATPFYLLLVVLYMAAGAAGYWVFTTTQEAKRNEDNLTKQRDELKKDVAEKQVEFDLLNLRSQEIEERYAVVEALGPQNRIFWSEKVNMIARARLNLAVYVTKIELQEQIDERETPESVRRREEWKKAKEANPKLRTPEPQAVKQPVINQTLVIQAIAYGNDSSQRLAQIRHFYENLNALEWTRESGEKARFLDRLASEFAQMPQKLDTVAGVEVLRFGFQIKADPQLDRTTDSTELAVAAGASTAGSSGPTISQKRAEAEEVLE